MRFIFTIHIKEIYYKELAQAIMEAEGSQNDSPTAREPGEPMV